MKLLTPEEVLQALKEDKSVEVKLGENLPWGSIDVFRMNLNVLLNPKNSFRLRQAMLTIEDVIFPRPEIKPLDKDTRYYLPFLLNPDKPYEALWDNVEMDYRYLKAGLIHLSEENATEHAKALIKLSGGTWN